MDIIFKRRSVRRFSDKQVSQLDIENILKAAMSAPSAGNEQPWHFIVIRDKESLIKLSGCSPYAKALAFAGVGIVVCGDLSRQIHEGFWVQDCSACVENMLLEAVSLGLSSVWLGVYPLEERINYISSQFKLPKHIIPFAVLPIGYALESHNQAQRYNEERVHYEHW